MPSLPDLVNAEDAVVVELWFIDAERCLSGVPEARWLDEYIMPCLPEDLSAAFDAVRLEGEPYVDTRERALRFHFPDAGATDLSCVPVHAVFISPRRAVQACLRLRDVHKRLCRRYADCRPLTREALASIFRSRLHPWVRQLHRPGDVSCLRRRMIPSTHRHYDGLVRLVVEELSDEESDAATDISEASFISADFSEFSVSSSLPTVREYFSMDIDMLSGTVDTGRWRSRKPEFAPSSTRASTWLSSGSLIRDSDCCQSAQSTLRVLPR